MMPQAFPLADLPPERTCDVMAAELEALGQDIAAARRRARTPARPARRPRPSARPTGERVALTRREAVLIRPIRPDDRGPLQSLMARLGALTRYRRFLAPLTRLTSHQLTYLTRIDHVDHDALVALDPHTGELVGVARYLRDPTEPRRARLAAVVADDWQGRGVGTALIERLGARARANGVEIFCGATVAGNHAAVALMRHALVTLADEWSAGASELSGPLGAPWPVPEPSVAASPA